MQVALLDGSPVVAFDLSDDAFAAVKDAYRGDHSRLRFSDGSEAVPRSGKRVSAHFAHKPGEGAVTEPETVHHIQAKRVVRDVAVRRGWEATVEARHPTGAWQADVLLCRGGRRIAFEVQWSAQELAEYERRTARYTEDNVEVVWLARYSSRTWWDVMRAVPSLPFQAGGIGTFRVTPLEVAIDACLALLETMVEAPADAPSVTKTVCYHCGNVFGYRPAEHRWGLKEPLGAAERQVLGRWAAELKHVYSATARTDYDAWHCPHCRRMQGDAYLDGEPFALVEGRLVPDVRGKSLWQLVEASVQLAEEAD